MRFADLPDLMTIREAAAALGISKTTAYELARLWEHTDGAHGLPVLKVGRGWRVIKKELIEAIENRTLGLPTAA